MATSKNRIDWENDPITKGIGSIVADRDLSINHDKYLYGKREKHQTHKTAAVSKTRRPVS
jgi:hypothetical protein